MRSPPGPPDALSDGSPARPPPVELEGVDGPTVSTRVRVLQSISVDPGSRTASCLDSSDDAGARVVERVGTSGTSVSFLTRDGREAYACDSTEGRATGESSWCGRSFGRLHAGRLRDPRLSLTCRGIDEEPLGFAWIQPTAATSYLVVTRPGYSESYVVAGAVPVRIVTDDVDLGSSTAAFAVSEHARDGRRLRRYRLEARVSG